MSPESELRPMSEAARLTNTFLEPKAAFADIAARPRPWAPLVLLIVLAVTFMTVFNSRVGWDRYMRQKMETTAQVQNMPPEQRERVIQMQTRIGPYMGYAGAVFGPPVMALIVAGVVLLTGKMAGATLTFKQMFSISAYAFLPGMLNSAAAVAVLFLKNPDDFNLENPTAFNLGAFLDPQSTGKAILALAGSVDVFAVWSAILLAVGITAASRRTSFGKAFTAVLIPWVLWIGIKAGLAALRG